MSKLKVVESYDGRLPEYQVIKEVSKTELEIIKTFDTYEEAIKWVELQNENLTPCGEENPCE